MNFWDASALVPLVVQEPETNTVMAILTKDQHIVYWWSTPVECLSALWRRHREGDRSRDEVEAVTADIDSLLQAGFEVQPGEDIRQLARRLLADHPLRAADALQLAAAMTWNVRTPGIAFTRLDRRLREAVSAEGLRLLSETM